MGDLWNKLGDRTFIKKRIKGFSRAEVNQILESGGKLSWAQLLRCKTRYFTDGVVIGSKGFVDDFFGHLKSDMGEMGRFLKRSSGARKMRRVEGKELHTMRDLKKNVIEP